MLCEAAEKGHLGLLNSLSRQPRMSCFCTFQSTGIYCLSNKNPACSDKNRQMNGLITYPRQAGSKNRQMNGLIARLYLLIQKSVFRTARGGGNWARATQSGSKRGNEGWGAHHRTYRSWQSSPFRRSIPRRYGTVLWQE